MDCNVFTPSTSFRAITESKEGGDGLARGVRACFTLDALLGEEGALSDNETQEHFSPSPQILFFLTWLH